MQNAANTPADTTALLAVIRALQHENAYLRLQLAKARRERFGRSSERAGDLLNQLSLGFADEVSASNHDRESDLKKPIIAKRERKSQRQSLPDFLPREEHVLATNDSCGCPACGGALKFLGPRRQRNAGVCAGQLQGDSYRQAQIGVRSLRHYCASACAIAPDCAWPGRAWGCSRKSWWLNIATTNPFTGKAPFTPVTVSCCLVQRWPIGWRAVANYCAHWFRRCTVT